MTSMHSAGGRRVVGAISCLVTLSFGAIFVNNSASASSPAISPISTDASHAQSAAAVLLPTTGSWAPYPSGTVNPMAVSGVISAGGCGYRQANDDPHYSSTAGDVSIHGWWLYASGSCPSKATVTAGLQAYHCDAISGCYWITIVYGPGSSVYSGGGSSNWNNARHTCSAQGALVGWRGFTDVDLPGINDPSGVTYSTIQNLACTP